MLPLCAIKRKNGEYIYPRIANKTDKYDCPECNRELFLRQGSIRIHHFAHYKQDDPCNYYTKPTESQIHKNAKMLLKQLLENKTPISFIRTCRYCNKHEEYDIPEIDIKSNINIEYRFEYNGLKIADVAYTYENEIVCLFEIFHTHKTKNENRPEPWFEINASSFICHVNTNNESILKIHCIRNELCEECIEKNNCKGYGECLTQISEKKYIRNQDFQCSFNCVPKVCEDEYCNEIGPQWYFDCKDGLCINCDMGCEPLRTIMLDVPFSEKNHAKRLGAKFEFFPYKKWIIKSNHKNKDIILSKFKEWKCPY
jgi:uncharacterized protein YkuJ